MIAAEKVYEEIQKDGTTKYFIRTRKFLGKTEDFNSRDEEAFEKKHLKAYLRGHKEFRHLYNLEKGRTVPAWYTVQQGVTVTEITPEQAEKSKQRLVEAD